MTKFLRQHGIGTFWQGSAGGDANDLSFSDLHFGGLAGPKSSDNL
jgi:hypothetical protein